jgi:hypothetical protein
VACPGNRGLPALLGHFTIRTGANHENRSRGVRGGGGLKFNLAAFAACPHRRFTAMSWESMSEEQKCEHFEWQMYNSLCEEQGVKATLKGFWRFRAKFLIATKQTVSEEDIAKWPEECEEVKR